MSKDDDSRVSGADANDPNRGDDGWDDWDDDDELDGRPGGGATDTRLIAVVIVAAVAIIATILFTRSDSDDKATSDPQAETGQPDGADEGAGGDDGEEDGEIPDWPWAIGGQGQNIDEPGLYLWSDLEGVHLRSNADDPLTVVVTSDDPIMVKDAGAGVTASTTEGTEITFEFPADVDGSDGPDLDVTGFVTEFSVEARTSDGPLPLEQFFVGDSANAAANPAIFRRGE